MISVEPGSWSSTHSREVGQRCLACGALHYPARTICRLCRARRFAAQVLSGRGVVHAFLGAPASSARHAPDWVPAWVELEEGVLVRAQLRPQDAVLGLPVALVPRRERIRRNLPSIGHAFAAIAERGRAPQSLSGGEARPSVEASPLSAASPRA